MPISRVSPHFPGFPFKPQSLQAKFPVLRLGLNSSDDIGNLPKADVVAVLAHPDDETFMSGTLAKLTASGYRVQMVYVTSGDAGKNLLGRYTMHRELASLRERELKRALKTLKINLPPVVLRYPDGRTDFDAPIIQADLEAILRQSKPGVVLTFGPDGMTGHEDHINVGQLTSQAATNTAADEQVYHMALTPEKLSKRVKLEDWPLEAAQHAPDVRVNVRDVLKTKYQTMQKYASQFTQAEVDHLRAWYLKHPFEEFVRA